MCIEIGNVANVILGCGMILAAVGVVCYELGVVRGEAIERERWTRWYEA